MNTQRQIEEVQICLKESKSRIMDEGNFWKGLQVSNFLIGKFVGSLFGSDFNEIRF